MSDSIVLTEKWPVLGRHVHAAAWLQVWSDLGRAPRTIDAYGRGLSEYLLTCEREGVDPVAASRASVAVYVRELTSRSHHRGANVVSIDSGTGLSNATIQQRLVPVRLFYDFLMEEGLRESNPVGRGRYTPGQRTGSAQRGLVPRLTKLPWIPSEQEWLQLLETARAEPVRNRVMLALAYDAALRREELCSLRTDDVDPAHRTLRIRAEATKNRLERVVPYSAPTGVLLSGYLAHRAGLSRARGPLFLSESHRNHAQPLTLWTWSKVVRRLAVASGVERFSTHTTRHLCLTDLARMGWEVHAIAAFSGHRHTDSTLRYINSRELHQTGEKTAGQQARRSPEQRSACPGHGPVSWEDPAAIAFDARIAHQGTCIRRESQKRSEEGTREFVAQAYVPGGALSGFQYLTPPVKISPATLTRAYDDAGYFSRNVRTIEVLIDRDAVASGAAAAGEPWQHYDLGHGFCSYTFFEQCQHRMACAKCDFYTPKASSKGQLLEAKDNLQRMLAGIPLTDDERAAVDDGQAALDQLLDRLADIPTPAGPTPRQIGVPATVTLLPVVDATS